MADKKHVGMLDVISVMSIIMDHKLNGHNYLDRTKTV